MSSRRPAVGSREDLLWERRDLTFELARLFIKIVPVRSLKGQLVWAFCDLTSDLYQRRILEVNANSRDAVDLVA